MRCANELRLPPRTPQPPWQAGDRSLPSPAPPCPWVPWRWPCWPRNGTATGWPAVGLGDEQMLLRLVGLTLLVAGLARAAGVSAAVGAFLVGLALPASFAERARAVMRPLRDLFAATF